MNQSDRESINRRIKNTESVKVKIGKYSIEMTDRDGIVWIEDMETGEGSDFHASDLFSVIDEFYRKHL